MAQNTVNTQTQATNNTSSKEEKKMTAREKWMASLQRGQELGYKAAHKAGYGIGYGTTTVVEETKYVARKIKTAIDGTTTVKEFKDGYYDGKNNAYYDFVQRSVQREVKAREKADSKAMKQAVDEMLADADICM